MSVMMILRACTETVGYPLLGPSLIFILTVCSFNFANNLQTLLALVLTVYCSRNIKLTEDTGPVHKYQSCKSLYFSTYCRM